jgi:hypothetical protein
MVYTFIFLALRLIPETITETFSMKQYHTLKDPSSVLRQTIQAFSPGNLCILLFEYE